MAKRVGCRSKLSLAMPARTAELLESDPDTAKQTFEESLEKYFRLDGSVDTRVVVPEIRLIGRRLLERLGAASRQLQANRTAKPRNPRHFDAIGCGRKRVSEFYGQQQCLTHFGAHSHCLMLFSRQNSVCAQPSSEKGYGEALGQKRKKWLRG